MQRLLLIRHAKAAVYGREPGDHSRPLADKGHAHASILGTMLADAGWVPDVALVSTAMRTRQTWDDIAAAFTNRAAHFEEALYLASPKVLAQAAIKHGKKGQTLALIGHNPGIAILAYQLVKDGFDHEAKAVRALEGNFKTGWAAAFEIRDEGSKLVQLFDPRTA